MNNKSDKNSLPFIVVIPPYSHDQWRTMFFWCNENIGKLGKDWLSQVENGRLSQKWNFLREEDAVLFQMVWG